MSGILKIIHDIINKLVAIRCYILKKLKKYS